MKTPMYNLLFKKDHDLNDQYAKMWIKKEKEFAQKCFIAGENYAIDRLDCNKNNCTIIEDNFDQFYEQFFNKTL